MARRNLALAPPALAPLAPWGCKDCAFVQSCGGLEGQQNLYGCFSGCGGCGVERGKCDYTCPRKPDFWRGWAEIGGLNPRPQRPLPGLKASLPRYAPILRHGYRRTNPLPTATVAINTFEVLNTKCRARFDSPDSLRTGFKAAPNAQVILISVKEDAFVEAFWANRNSESLASLTRLGVAAMSTPNFSLFDDAPRLHSVRNIWRIIRCAEELAGAGITPVLHVNALCRADWRMWASVLRQNPSVRHVCKEFQTGLKDPNRAREAIEGLRWLQDEVGREIHPIIVGGRRVVHDIANHFAAYTIADSVPFFATVKRKRIAIAGTTVLEVDNPTAPTEPLDLLLQDNVRTYERLVSLCSTHARVEVPDTFDDEPWTRPTMLRSAQ